MKIILSRKGFDSRYPSPILPDGKMLSLPIPISGDVPYCELNAPGGKTYEQVIKELHLQVDTYTGGKGAHLDPDLVRTARDRRPGWLPAFGQNKGAQTVLGDRGVSKGDLFLFFGTFQHSEKIGGQLRPRRGSAKIHAIFGYLEIGEKYEVNENAQLPNWLNDHLHAMGYRRKIKGNTIYVATPKLSFHPSYPGGGVFEFDERLRLTKKGESKSRWNLDPEIFQHLTFSCDENKRKEDVWTGEYYQSPRTHCQEIVIPADEGVNQWASNLIKNSRLWSD